MLKFVKTKLSASLSYVYLVPSILKPAILFGDKSSALSFCWAKKRFSGKYYVIKNSLGYVLKRELSEDYEVFTSAYEKKGEVVKKLSREDCVAIIRISQLNLKKVKGI